MERSISSEAWSAVEGSDDSSKLLENDEEDTGEQGVKMTINNEISRNDYLGTGATGTFDYDFRAYNVQSFLIIVTEIATGIELEYDSSEDLDGTVGVVGSGSDFEVDSLKNQNGGKVYRTAGNLEDTHSISILLRPFIIQDTPVANAGQGHRRRLELEFDRSRQIDLYQQNQLDACLKLDRNINPSNFDMTINPGALQFAQVNAANDGWQMVDLAELGEISLPGVAGIAAYSGSNTFVARTITGTNGITVTQGDGQAGAPNISGQPLQDQIDTNTSDIDDLQADVLEAALPFFATEQVVPDNTVLLGPGQTRSSKSPEAPAVDVAAGSANAITFPSVSADSRIDILRINNDTQVVTRVAGLESASPVPPAYSTEDNEDDICEVTISDTGGVTINNADIRYIMNRTPPSIKKFGRKVLIGHVNANGTIALNEDGGSGASFSVLRVSAGLYDVALTGLSEFSSIQIDTQLNDNNSTTTLRGGGIKGVTNETSDTTGRGTTTGFRVRTVRLIQDVSYLEEQAYDIDWSFTVEGIN